MARAESEPPKTPSSRVFFRAESGLDPSLQLAYLCTQPNLGGYWIAGPTPIHNTVALFDENNM